MRRWALAGREHPQKAVSASRRHVMVFRDPVSCQIRSSASQRARILCGHGQNQLAEQCIRPGEPHSCEALRVIAVERLVDNSVPAWVAFKSRQTHGNLLFVGANRGLYR